MCSAALPKVHSSPSVHTTEAEGRRKLTQRGALPGLAGGGGRMICTLMGGPYRLPCRSVPHALHREKKLSDIPVPSRDITYHTLPGRE